MSALQPIEPNNFFADGLVKIKENFDTVLRVAQSTRSTDNDSGICTPVPMTMGSTSSRWKIPTGVIGNFVIFDHGFVLNRDQYTVDEEAKEIVLTTPLPAPPTTPPPPNYYNMTIAWSQGQGGIVPPIKLAQNTAKGSRYWILPKEYGPNVLVFNMGLLLMRSEYKVEDGHVVLTKSPTAPYEISASWGSGSPGLRAPVDLKRDMTTAPGVHEYILPTDAGVSVVVQDSGLMLDTSNYTIDYDRKRVRLNYNPALLTNITASWGLRMEGVYLEDAQLTPDTDGTIKEFYMSQSPLEDTVLVKGTNPAGYQFFYVRGTDFKVESKKIVFNAAPPADMTLTVSSMVATLTDFSTESVGVIDTIGFGDSQVTLEQGVDLNLSKLDQQFEYDPAGRVKFMWYKKSSGEIVKQVEFTYNPDDSFNKVITTAGGKTVTKTFEYDALGQISLIKKDVL